MNCFLRYCCFVTLVICAVTLSACSSKKNSDEKPKYGTNPDSKIEQEVEKAARSFFNAWMKKDYKSMWELMHPDLRAKAEYELFEKGIKGYLIKSFSMRELKSTNAERYVVNIHRSMSAAADPSFTNVETNTIEVLKHEGRWYIGRLGVKSE